MFAEKSFTDSSCIYWMVDKMMVLSLVMFCVLQTVLCWFHQFCRSSVQSHYKRSVAQHQVYLEVDFGRPWASHRRPPLSGNRHRRLITTILHNPSLESTFITVPCSFITFSVVHDSYKLPHLTSSHAAALTSSMILSPLELCRHFLTFRLIHDI